ncbi:MAG: hypothetical protein J6Y08_10210 [Clostridiales bacterium]|nr:hypothetical protein [Clostridiales bacterium]
MAENNEREFHNEPEESANESLKERVLFAIVGFFCFLGSTTVKFFKNLPVQIRNKFKEKINERRRMPKRKSIHKVYVLVGYTTKEYVDRKYRKERTLLIIRKVLVAAILILVVVMVYRWIMPQLDTEEYKQMIGINDIDDLTSSDPFATETTNAVIGLESEAVTPIPSDTTLPSSESST